MTTAKSARKTTAAAPRKAVPARKTAPARQSANQPEVKPVPPTAPVKTAAAKTEKKNKPEKVKVVRDSFTIPKTEYTQISELKKRAIAGGVVVKKSELIRAGLLLLSSQSDAGLSKALLAVPTLKTGRPGKG